MFTYTEGIPIMMGMIINFPQETLPRELAGLAVNLSFNPRNCELIIANKVLTTTALYYFKHFCSCT